MKVSKDAVWAAQIEEVRVEDPDYYVRNSYYPDPNEPVDSWGQEVYSRNYQECREQIGRTVEEIGASLVADPFMGLGSSGLAARSIGVEFLGVELRLRNYLCAYAKCAATEATIARILEVVAGWADSDLGRIPIAELDVASAVRSMSHEFRALLASVVFCGWRRQVRAQEGAEHPDLRAVSYQIELMRREIRAFPSTPILGQRLRLGDCGDIMSVAGKLGGSKRRSVVVLSPPHLKSAVSDLSSAEEDSVASRLWSAVGEGPVANGDETELDSPLRRYSARLVRAVSAVTTIANPGSRFILEYVNPSEPVDVVATASAALHDLGLRLVEVTVTDGPLSASHASGRGGFAIYELFGA